MNIHGIGEKKINPFLIFSLTFSLKKKQLILKSNTLRSKRYIFTIDCITYFEKIYQGRISPFECQNVPVLERFKFSINFAKREAASSGEISPFPPIISVETKPG